MKKLSPLMLLLSLVATVALLGCKPAEKPAEPPPATPPATNAPAAP